MLTKGNIHFKVSGMSIGIDMGRLILPKGMRIAPAKPAPTCVRGRAPGIFNVYASDHADSWTDVNHSSWTLIYRNTLLQGPTDAVTVTAWGDFADSTYTQITFDATLRTYQYLTHKSWNGCGEDSLNFAEWNLFGDEIIQVTPSGFL